MLLFLLIWGILYWCKKQDNDLNHPKVTASNLTNIFVTNTLTPDVNKNKNARTSPSASETIINVFKDADDKLPSGWSKHRNSAGNVYFYNSSTQLSTWIRPHS